MPDSSYVILLKWTQGGVANFKDIKNDLKAAEHAFNQEGGAFRDVLFCMGEYDAVVVATAPSDSAVHAFALALSSAGSLRTTTLPAVPASAIDAVLAQATRIGEAYIGVGGRRIGGGDGGP